MTPTSHRLAMLREWLANAGLDSILLTTADAHQSEDPPDCARTLRWLTGFTGSLARALVLRDRAVLFVDGRYQVQVAKQVDLGDWEIAHLYDYPPEKWLAQNAPEGIDVALDPMLWTVTQMRDLKTALAPSTITVSSLADDPFRTIWQDRPLPPLGAVRSVPDAVSGMSSVHKQRDLQSKMTELGLSLWVESRPDDIAWLFNRRGSDVPMHPIPLSFALIPETGAAEWVIAPEKLTNDLPENVIAHAPDALSARLGALAAGGRVGLDPDFSPVALADIITKAGGTVIEMRDPITLSKARKNAVELDGFHAAHVADGCAWVNFLAWLGEEVPLRAATDTPVTEFEAEQKIQTFRAEQPGFLEPSFRAISASGSNAAMCHYNATPDKDVAVSMDAPYLLDSGGQYVGGTTDATRTTGFGPVSDEIRGPATAVLKGFLALSMARFPLGSVPHQLDALARAPLWALGLDYDHGTGHGVGHNLLVHEHPHRLGKLPNPVPLEPGNILTIEPGYYAADRFGLRVENQVEVVASGEGFCEFRPMTLVPIDLRLFDLAALSTEELSWIDRYHARVRLALADKVSPHARAWLNRMTTPVSGDG